MDPRPALPRILSFFLGAQELYRIPLFSPNEVFCGPDTSDRVLDGRIIRLRTPLGSHDAGRILGLLPKEQLPDLAVVKADATQRNLPRNLACFDCPKVLIVGDTHHMKGPLSSVITYAQSEPFDFIIFDHTCHHAHWFAKAGLRNLHWIPAVDFAFMPREPRASRSRPLTFVGQAGRLHPWRRDVLSQVRRAGLPLEILGGTLSETADLYSDSDITLNVSLNGDLNLRVFEALGAGGFLLTDELSEASGLRRLFEPGRHLDTWQTPDELIEKIRHYLAHPAEAARIREAGRLEVATHHHPDIKVRELLDLVYSGRTNPKYELRLGAAPDPVKPFHIANLDEYEWIQEIHRTSRSVTVYCGEPLLTEFAAVADLPRLGLAPLSAVAPLAPAAGTPGASDSHVLLFGDDASSLPALLSRFSGAYVIAPTPMAARLSEWGYFGAARNDGRRGLYKMSRPTAHLAKSLLAGAEETVRLLLPHVLSCATAADDCLTLADCAEKLGLGAIRSSALQRALAVDRNCLPALVRLARIALLERNPVFAGLALEEAARFGSLSPQDEQVRSDLVGRLSGPLAPYHSVSGSGAAAPSESPRRFLIVTNLFPPQELGGYGRMMWEFARGLRRRGHKVSVVTANAQYLSKAPQPDESEMESRVSRSLDLTGSWGAGGVNLVRDTAKVAAIESSNASRVLRAALAFGPDVILAGNLDLLGVQLLHEALAAGFPVLHAVANQAPGFATEEQPNSQSYWMAPCSDWNGRVLRSAGYLPARMSTVYPGARIDRFYRSFLPDTGTLRIAYASIVAPYKGTHVLVEALARLHALGKNFTAEIAGEALDAPYAEKLREFCLQQGMRWKVSFTGFLDRPALSSLFARSNVLVFPSQFAEPFGISQVEAMAAGLVVVTSGTGGAAEVVRDGRDGLVFKADDPGALAAKLGLLAMDRNAFQRLQGASQKRALQFSVDTSILQIEDLSSELLASGRALAPADEAEALSPALRAV